jgi:dinuclear metal center YbgI/SA1388 family protein
MVTAKLSDIIGIINKIAPTALAEEWDNPGLQLGDPAAPVERVMVALDPGPDAIAAAIASHCTLLLTHHPLIFKPLKRISAADATGSLIITALQNNLAIASLHTNYDVAAGGVNDLLAERLGLVDCQPLKVTSVEPLVKLSVFVPQGHEEPVLAALFRFGGFLGKYGDCSFRVAGTGTFKPLAGAKPFIGTVGERETVAESRLEVLIRRADQAAAVKALLAAHPYEEPAFDLVPLLNEGTGRGLGRIGAVPATTVGAFAEQVKERLGLPHLRLVGEPARPLTKVALCGGSGASLVREAARQGADLLVTGDVKYHEALDAQALGLALMDAGHFATERLMIAGLTEQLRQVLARRNLAVTVIPCAQEHDPFTIV